MNNQKYLKLRENGANNLKNGNGLKNVDNLWDKYYLFPFFDTLFKILTDIHYNLYYKKILRNIKPRRMSILELGGGTGLLSYKIKKEYDTNPTIVDNNLNANKKFLRYGFDRGYILSDVFKLKDRLKERKFDVVFSDCLLEHFRFNKRKKLIAIHKEFCKDKGYILITTPKPTIFSKFFSRFVVPEWGLSKKELIRLIENERMNVLDVAEGLMYISALAKLT